MAQSPPHKFGQIIGMMLEEAIAPLLEDFSKEHGLFFDKKGPRKPLRNGKKLGWQDKYGNNHDLDFVLEKGGTIRRQGKPIAFIETAWRRYTRHSRAKAQEIQGAILPIKETFYDSAPFIGVVTAGDWTEGALNQLRSLGFNVIHYPLDLIKDAFRPAGIEVYFDEDTPDSEIAHRIGCWEALSANSRAQVSETLRINNADKIEEFMSALDRVATRQIELIRVLPLHGTAHELESISDAIEFIQNYQNDHIHPLVKYEIEIRYTNGDVIQCRFENKQNAINFLHDFQSYGV